MMQQQPQFPPMVRGGMAPNNGGEFEPPGFLFRLMVFGPECLCLMANTFFMKTLDYSSLWVMFLLGASVGSILVPTGAAKFFMSINFGGAVLYILGTGFKLNPFQFPNPIYKLLPAVGNFAPLQNMIKAFPQVIDSRFAGLLCMTLVLVIQIFMTSQIINKSYRAIVMSTRQ